jgi:hypothetical protein
MRTPVVGVANEFCKENDRSNVCETFVGASRVCNLEEEMGKDSPHMSASKMKWLSRIYTYWNTGGCRQFSSKQIGFVLSILDGFRNPWISKEMSCEQQIQQ